MSQIQNSRQHMNLSDEYQDKIFNINEQYMSSDEESILLDDLICQWEDEEYEKSFIKN
jgi:hypothetical protein